MPVSQELLSAADRLCERLAPLRFAEPVTHVYNPLVHARASYAAYVTRFGDSPKRVLFLGMNPGPWGMVQTGVPFGEVPSVRDWMGIAESVDKPDAEHPKRPVLGFGCERSEVSGRRLWGLFAERYPEADDFFAEHYVVNYCPLVWMEESGRNRTPDKLPASEIAPVNEACDEHLAAHLDLLRPEVVVGVGGFAEKCLLRACEGREEAPRVGRVLHPSPASPAANRDWAGSAAKQLRGLGIW